MGEPVEGGHRYATRIQANEQVLPLPRFAGAWRGVSKALSGTGPARNCLQSERTICRWIVVEDRVEQDKKLDPLHALEELREILREWLHPLMWLTVGDGGAVVVVASGEGACMAVARSQVDLGVNPGVSSSTGYKCTDRRVNRGTRQWSRFWTLVVLRNTTGAGCT